MNARAVSPSPTVLAGIGLVLVLPALYFVVAAVTQYYPGVGQLFDVFAPFYATPRRLQIFNLVSPILFLSGGLIALGLNLYAVLRPSFTKGADEIVLSARVRPEPVNRADVALSCLLLLTLVGYALVENIAHALLN